MFKPSIVKTFTLVTTPSPQQTLPKSCAGPANTVTSLSPIQGNSNRILPQQNLQSRTGSHRQSKWLSRDAHEGITKDEPKLRESDESNNGTGNLILNSPLKQEKRKRTQPPGCYFASSRCWRCETAVGQVPQRQGVHLIRRYGLELLEPQQLSCCGANGDSECLIRELWRCVSHLSLIHI